MSAPKLMRQRLFLVVFPLPAYHDEIRIVQPVMAAIFYWLACSFQVRHQNRSILSFWHLIYLLPQIAGTMQRFMAEHHEPAADDQPPCHLLIASFQPRGMLRFALCLALYETGIFEWSDFRMRLALNWRPRRLQQMMNITGVPGCADKVLGTKQHLTSAATDDSALASCLS